MSNYAWLCEYGSHAVANTYGIVIQTEDYDGVERFWLENKERLGGGLNDIEKKKLESLEQQSYQFTKAWREREFIANLPIKLFKKPDVDHYFNTPKQDDIFFIITNGYLVINKKLYNVISQFNLGKTHFSQVYLYDIETKEQLLDEPYYFVNIAEKFGFLDTQNSLGIRPSFYVPSDPDRFISSPKDDDIIISKEVLNTGINMWTDSLLNSSLFFSDELVQALFKAGFTQKELGLIRCVIQ